MTNAAAPAQSTHDIPPEKMRLVVVASAAAPEEKHGHVQGMEGLVLAALGRLAAYDFPGNVRELENKIHQAMVVAAGPLIDEDDPSYNCPPPDSGILAPCYIYAADPRRSVFMADENGRYLYTVSSVGVIASDGDIQEGVAAEASSFAVPTLLSRKTLPADRLSWTRIPYQALS